jgi:hypothetical protein
MANIATTTANKSGEVFLLITEDNDQCLSQTVKGHILIPYNARKKTTKYIPGENWLRAPINTTRNRGYRGGRFGGESD